FKQRGIQFSMKKSTQLGFLSAALAASVALAGCASSNNASGGSTSGSGNSGGSAPAPQSSSSGGEAGGKILIATQSPLSGSQSA
ncbi:hypothetical protein MXD63_45575, partial [Frankia sp. Cpl3]|nr:hypothetical protein [Frankia sp. Cpl3]